MQPTDPTKFTDKAWEAIAQSQDVARRFQQQHLEVEHLAIALLEQNGLANRILSRAGVDSARLTQQLEAFTQRQPKVGKSDQLYLGRNLDVMLDRADAAKATMQDGYISVEHLLLGFAEDERVGRRLIKGFDLDKAKLETAIKAVRGSQSNRRNPRVAL